MAEHVWKVGNRVLHATRPEWGIGQILRTEKIRHEGADAQRLTIRFDRAGTKTISTAFAALQDADAMSTATLNRTIEYAQSEADNQAQADDIFSSSPAKPDHKALLTLPDAATDPFIPLAKRLDATINLYRFESHGSSLLDWAAAQTRLADPLTLYSRQELEMHFARFRQLLDAHLQQLVVEARNNEPQILAGLGKRVSPAMREMLTRMLTSR